MKKGLSILLAITLLVSVLTPVTVQGSSGLGTADVIGTAGVVTLGTDGDIIQGSLPTNANLHFTIDPLNLLDVTPGSIVDDTARNTAVDFGDNNVLAAYNTGSVPLLLTAALSVTATGVTTVLTEAAVSTAGDTAAAPARVLLWAEPSETVRNATTAPFVGAEYVIPFGAGAGAANAHFRLQGRESNLIAGEIVDNVLQVTREFSATAAPMYGTALAFGGIINADAEAWGAPGVAVSVNAVFTLAQADAAVIAAPLFTAGDVTAYGLLGTYPAQTQPALIPLPEGGATGGPGGALVAQANGWIDIPVPNGAAVAFVNVGGTWHTIPTASVLISANNVGLIVPAGETVVRIYNSDWSVIRTVTVTRP